MWAGVRNGNERIFPFALAETAEKVQLSVASRPLRILKLCQDLDDTFGPEISSTLWFTSAHTSLEFVVLLFIAEQLLHFSTRAGWLEEK
jgi:hypothetical protein